MDIETARLRADMLHETRSFFRSLGFLETDTPLLAEKVIPESTIELFPARFSHPYGEDRELYLLPSPEYWLKKVLGAFPETPIFQLAKAFRNREQTGRLHNIEFTMLEWYRPQSDYLQSMEDTEALIRHMCRAAGREEPRFKRLSVEEACHELAGIELRPLCAGLEPLQAEANRLEIAFEPSDSWNDLFQRIFISLVEPEIPTDEPLFLTDYPAEIVCLAKKKPGTPYRERWELYWQGMELANCYSELIDPAAVRSLFEEEGAEKERIAAVPVAIDREYWRVFEGDYPESSGVALGFDRLMMILAEKEAIDEVIYFPFSPD